jgi:putative nucleotidyltransferase with HDIG domain
VEENGTLEEIKAGVGSEDFEYDHLSSDLPLLQDDESRAKGVSNMKTWGSSLADKLAEVNKELWLVLSLLAIAAVMNYLITGHRMVLGLYTLPTLFSAYFYGRRHAILTAFASVFLVGLLAHFNTGLFNGSAEAQFAQGRWYDLAAWAGILVVTAYAMGTLHENSRARLNELRETYHGLLLILRQFVSKDKYTENHSYRVSIYATKIAAYLRLSPARTEDVRAASLLHDIGKLDTSRKLLYKAARLSQDEFLEMKKHVERSASMLEPAGGALRRIIPIILAHHDKFDGSGYNAKTGKEIPLEARVIAVADVYDSLTSDRPYRKAMAPFEAKSVIAKGSGGEFDPKVVKAFLAAFAKGEMEVPEVVL